MGLNSGFKGLSTMLNVYTSYLKRAKMNFSYNIFYDSE